MKLTKIATRKAKFLIISILAAAPLGAALVTAPAYAAVNTCDWTGASSQNWSNAANWSNCGGTAPQNGDNLVFNTTSLTSGAGSLNNDISNLQVGSISFTGSNNLFGYILSGNGISLSGGFSDTSNSSNSFAMDITLTSNQTFSTDTSNDVSSTANTLAIGNHTLTINSTSSGIVDLLSAITGTGEIDFNSATESNFINHNNPGFSGIIKVASGRLIINASNTDQLGTGQVIVASGASLQESINANGTYSIANPITLGGSGIGSTGAIDVHGFSATGTVNFTGAITLTSDAVVSLESANANFTGTVSGCGYSISKKSGSSGTLSGNLTGSCNTGGSSPSGSSSGTTASSSSTSSSTADPAAPSTGYGQPANQNTPIALAIISGTMLFAGVGLLRQEKRRAVSS